MDRETFLYKLYNQQGRCLYVGIAYDVDKRLSQHKTDKEWYKEVRDTVIKRFPNRGLAESAEHVWIHKEAPVYNVRGAVRRSGSPPSSTPVRDVIKRSERSVGKLIDALKANGGEMTRSEVQDVFSHNLSAQQIDDLVSGIPAIQRTKRKVVAGRPPVVYILVGQNAS